jgi:putative peptidoglycan lipid II flippase
VLADPLVIVMFYGGEFNEHAARMTALALRAYAAGLVGFSAVKILAPAFFAREDTKTPVRIAILAMILNLLLSIALAWSMTKYGIAGPHAGLAAATSLAAVLNALLLYRALRKDNILRHSDGWKSLLVRILIANTAMYLALLQLARPLAWWIAASLVERVVYLGLTIIAGFIAYAAALLILGARTSQFRMRAE